MAIFCGCNLPKIPKGGQKKINGANHILIFVLTLLGLFSILCALVGILFLYDGRKKTRKNAKVIHMDNEANLFFVCTFDVFSLSA